MIEEEEHRFRVVETIETGSKNTDVRATCSTLGREWAGIHNGITVHSTLVPAVRDLSLMGLGLRLSRLWGIIIIPVLAAIWIREGWHASGTGLGLVSGGRSTAVAQAARNARAVAVGALAHARATLEIRIASATGVLLATIVLSIPRLGSARSKVVRRREVLALSSIAVTVLRVVVHAVGVAALALPGASRRKASVRSRAASPAVPLFLHGLVVSSGALRGPINWLHPVVKLL